METYARELYREFGTMESGYEFIGYGSKEFMKLDHSWFPGEVVDSKISGENRFLWAYGELFAVARAAKRLGADLIHSPAMLGPRKSSMPTVVTMHDMLYWSHPELMSTPLYTRPVMWMQKQASRNATRILTDSESSSREIQKYLKYDSARIDVVALAGTVAPTAAGTEKERANHFIIAVGNRRPHKNFQGLVRAMARVEESVRPKLVVTGSRGDDPLKPIVDELGLGAWVDLRSWVSPEELEDLYARASALVMPSFCDGFCLPALESMMVGLPVMLSDIPVYREVGGDAALYFHPSDLDSIAHAITRISTEPGLCRQLSTDGHEWVMRFSWQKVARETAESFEKALAATR